MSVIKPVERTPNPSEPWALVWKEQFGITKVIKAHVANLPMLCREYGWRVLITDDDVPLALGLGEVWKQTYPQPVVKRPTTFYPSEDGA